MMTEQLDSDDSCLFGCDVFLSDPPSWLFTKRVGVLANQASVTRTLQNVVDALVEAGARVTAVFSPQHGFHAEKQANMIESDHGVYPRTGVPVFSLYGEVRRPTPAMLERVDVLLVDLQDVGTRVYTYGTTVGLCVEAAADAGIPVVVLDRPNPIGGAFVEGNPVREELRSFVGRYPIPMRHGLTLGELALWVARSLERPELVEVVHVAGWRREKLWPATGRPWIFPSPNMPSWETALVYPGMVLLEGTNVSEGRGTTLPFLLFGAPFVDPEKLAGHLDPRALDGVVLRPVSFEPTFDKWAGELCRGFHLVVTDPARFRPYCFGLALLRSFLKAYPDRFRWLPPPYEYEYEHLPIDILIGDAEIRKALEDGEGLDRLEARWAEALKRYQSSRESLLLYS
ncbi:exo-beta-N-acetylmuramidase NamZ family protein [Desulfacinum infernum]|nr:DUF1343 domain-containing protein [Desulfacinum infernum]